MQEVATDSVVTVDAAENVTDLLERRVAQEPNKALFSIQTSPGTWEDVTAQEFHSDVRVIARGLAQHGIEPGDHVAIMAPTRYEWTLLDLAIWYAGAITVPIYETSSPSQIAWILEDAEVKAVFADAEEHRHKVEIALRQEKLPDLVGLWLIDELDEVRDAASEGPAPEEMEKRRAAANLEDIATIIYTSGTTGRPKGCELTHGNFSELSQETMGSELGTIVNSDASTILFIPLAHVFARFISVVAIAAGAKVGHSPDVKNLVDDLGSFQPSFLLAVPRVFEKVYNGAKTKADESGRGKIFAAGAQTAIDYSKALQEHGKVPLPLKLRHALFDKLLYGKIRQATGGKVTHAISGGGPLGARLGHFFYGVGIHILEGYGLTETTAPVTVNLPSQTNIGSVGLPLPGNAIKIADDGEVLARGVCLFRGYHNREDLNEETFDEDGWFATGDLGTLDENGFLTITGRKKEMLVTAGGKNVSPAQLEDLIRADMLVSQAMVVGDNRPFIAALITLDPETAPDWLKANGLDTSLSGKELAEHPKVLEHVQKVIDGANESVSRAESIRAFRIADEDFTVESGMMTPSLKIKRSVIAQHWEHLIEDIYNQPKPSN